MFFSSMENEPAVTSRTHPQRDAQMQSQKPFTRSEQRVPRQWGGQPGTVATRSPESGGNSPRRPPGASEAGRAFGSSPAAPWSLAWWPLILPWARPAPRVGPRARGLGRSLPAPARVPLGLDLSHTAGIPIAAEWEAVSPPTPAEPASGPRPSPPLSGPAPARPARRTWGTASSCSGPARRPQEE
ncbi:proline-rich protein HaeIII subfamily 1-like [Saccopteryx leptura]|uniref:proline-rich protein HaeIII subfamily 1-like n=1 Tax=Saccopteryx leptura TaxID=249018 RepID=UPI00339D0AFB